jgi:3-oxoacyl-[acyl-carrier protein] reductase
MVARARMAILVTGGATGIGAAVVDRVVAHGWNVAICYFGEAEREAAELARDGATDAGVAAICIDVDAIDDSKCRLAASRTIAAFGTLDALVCSAGTTRVVLHRDLDALSAEDFDRTSKVNTLGPFQMARACAEALRKSGGAIVIVSSYGGVMGSGSSMAYAASKGAANTLTLSLAAPLHRRSALNAAQFTSRALRSRSR